MIWLHSKPKDAVAPVSVKPQLRTAYTAPQYRDPARERTPLQASGVRRAESASRQHTDGYTSANSYGYRPDPSQAARPSSQHSSYRHSLAPQPPPAAPPVAQRPRKSSRSHHVPAPAPPAPQVQPTQEPVSSKSHHRPQVASSRSRTSSAPTRPLIKSILKPAVPRPQEIVDLSKKDKDAGYYSDGPLKTQEIQLEEAPNAPPRRKWKVETTNLRIEKITLNKFLVPRETFKVNRQPPLMYYDIGIFPFHPEMRNVRIRTDSGTWRHMHRDEYNAPASSHCILTEMNIVCQGAPWPVKLMRDSDGGIRVRDIFHAIYDAYRVLLTDQERIYFHDQLHIPHFLDAYDVRCKESALAGENQGMSVSKHLRRGPMRMDMLMGKRIFNGLVQTGDKDWELMVYGQWWATKEYGRTIFPGP